MDIDNCSRDHVSIWTASTTAVIYAVSTIATIYVVAQNGLFTVRHWVVLYALVLMWYAIASYTIQPNKDDYRMLWVAFGVFRYIVLTLLMWLLETTNTKRGIEYLDSHSAVSLQPQPQPDNMEVRSANAFLYSGYLTIFGISLACSIMEFPLCIMALRSVMSRRHFEDWPPLALNRV